MPSIHVETLPGPVVCWAPERLGPWPLNARPGDRVVWVVVWLWFYVSVWGRA